MFITASLVLSSFIIQASYNEVTASNNVQHPDLEELAYGTQVSCLACHIYSVLLIDDQVPQIDHFDQVTQVHGRFLSWS